MVAARPPSRRELGAYVGMVIFLGVFAMCFAGLFFAYAVMRTQSEAWPPAGFPSLPLGLPSLNTALLLASSFTLARGLAAVRGGRERALAGWVGLTLALGAAFVALQFIVWVSVARHGLRWDGSKYGSVFYALTWFHALHVLAGLGVLAWILFGALRGRYTAAKHTAVRLGALFWHFVDVVWLVLFLSVYVF